MSKIIELIKAWYKGDDGEPEYNYDDQIYECKRPPKRHWTAQLVEFLVIPFVFAYKSIAKNPNIFVTQLFALIALIIAACTLYLQIKEDDDKYNRCIITSTDKNTVNIECSK